VTTFAVSVMVRGELVVYDPSTWLQSAFAVREPSELNTIV
jgi:hypothetical protein